MGEAERAMPKYQSHKQVWALKIADLTKPALAVNEEWDGTMYIHPEENGYAPFPVSGDYMRKHEPKVGGYYVVYADGYKSWSPAEAFESGYTRL